MPHTKVVVTIQQALGRSLKAGKRRSVGWEGGWGGATASKGYGGRKVAFGEGGLVGWGEGREGGGGGGGGGPGL